MQAVPCTAEETIARPACSVKATAVAWLTVQLANVLSPYKQPVKLSPLSYHRHQIIPGRITGWIGINSVVHYTHYISFRWVSLSHIDVI